MKTAILALVAVIGIAVALPTTPTPNVKTTQLPVNVTDGPILNQTAPIMTGGKQIYAPVPIGINREGRFFGWGGFGGYGGYGYGGYPYYGGYWG